MKTKALVLFVATFFGLFPAVAFGEDDRANEILRQLDTISKEAESWSAKQRAIARDRLIDCIDAFGNEEFCSCLNNELHWVLSFESYIRVITTAPKGISKDLEPDEKLVVDSVYKAREKCVKQSFEHKN
jgi:hypothetical protein